MSKKSRAKAAATPRAIPESFASANKTAAALASETRARTFERHLKSAFGRVFAKKHF